MKCLFVVIVTLVALSGCTSTVDPVVRAKVLAKGHPLFLPVLDFQITHHIVPTGIRTVRLELPETENPDEYIQALRVLHPDITCVSDGEPSTKSATLSIKGIRRTGALIGEVFGSVSKPGYDHVALYYLTIGRPKPGKPHVWAVVKEDIWPADLALPLRPH